MQKINSFLLILTFILSACTSAPQATITPEPTVTSTPPPTETPIPTATQTETLTPEPQPTEETHNLIEGLTLNVNLAPIITLDQVLSGDLAYSAKLIERPPFPETAKNLGWRGDENKTDSDVVLKEGCIGTMRELAISKIDGAEFGYPGNFDYILTVEVLAKEGEGNRILNINTNGIDELKAVRDSLKSTDGCGVGIQANSANFLNERRENSKWNIFVAINDIQGGSNVITIITSTAKTSGVLPGELEKMIVRPVER